MCVCGASSIAHTLRRRERVGRGAQEVLSGARHLGRTIYNVVYIATSELVSIKGKPPMRLRSVFPQLIPLKFRVKLRAHLTLQPASHDYVARFLTTYVIPHLVQPHEISKGLDARCVTQYSNVTAEVAR